MSVKNLGFKNLFPGSANYTQLSGLAGAMFLAIIAESGGFRGTLLPVRALEDTNLICHFDTSLALHFSRAQDENQQKTDQQYRQRQK